jgi:hypothetical protein
MDLNEFRGTWLAFVREAAAAMTHSSQPNDEAGESHSWKGSS